jgi:hypothetical protein
MLKDYYGLILLLLFSSSLAIAQPITSYEIIDIGVLNSDESHAVAINEQGQVLGKLKNHGKWNAFLWDKNAGLQILDLPLPEFNNYWTQTIHLNNKGQVAGINKYLFIFCPETGIYKILLQGDNRIIKFNDNAQLLVNSYDHGVYKIYLVSYENIIDLSKIFNQQFPEYSYITPITMNNKNEVIITAYNKSSKIKSFIWKNDNFFELFVEYGVDAGINISAIDDHGNMCGEIMHKDFAWGGYFINQSKKFQGELAPLFDPFNAEIPLESIIIRNFVPQFIFCLPCELRKKSDGVFYFVSGADVRKLMKPQSPYWFQDSGDVSICDQNSKGYVVGFANTIFPNRKHAFLAIPSGTKL